MVNNIYPIPINVSNSIIYKFINIIIYKYNLFIFIYFLEFL